MLIYKEELLNCTGLKVLKLPYETVEEAKKNRDRLWRGICLALFSD